MKTKKQCDWSLATIDYLKTLTSETLAKRAAVVLLISAGLCNKDIKDMTGMSERAIRYLRHTIEDSEATKELFKIKPGSGRKAKTHNIEEEVFRELDRKDYDTYAKVLAMLKEKFNVTGSPTLAARIVKRWKERKAM